MIVRYRVSACSAHTAHLPQAQAARDLATVKCVITQTQRGEYALIATLATDITLLGTMLAGLFRLRGEHVGRLWALLYRQVRRIVSR